MIQFGRPVSALSAHTVYTFVDKDISRSNETLPWLHAMEIRWLNYNRGQIGFILPINVACWEATPVTISLSPVLQHSTTKMWNCPAPKDYVIVTSLVLTCTGETLMMAIGYLNEMWLTSIRCSISVHSTTQALMPMDWFLCCHFITTSNLYVALLNFPTILISGNW